MKKVIITDTNNEFGSPFFGAGFLVSLIDRVQGKYVKAIPFMSCRAWLGDALLKQKNPKANFKPSYPFYFKVNIENGSTFIGISLGKDHKIETFLKNIKFLHQKEERAKVKKSKVYLTQKDRVLLIEGSKFWKDSCWKIMLYTFYLKCMRHEDPHMCDATYWEALLSNGNEDELLKRLKIQKEIFHPSVYGDDMSKGYHDREGFVSICSGRNPPMAKLLGLVTSEVEVEEEEAEIPW